MERFIPYVCIRYNQNLYNSQIPCFRSALIEYVGRDHLLFHNHTEKEEGVQTIKYPLIQYKTIFKKASIVALGAGARSIHKAAQPEMALSIGEEERNFMIEEFTFQHIQPGVTQKPNMYSLKTWMPFNQKNFEIFKQLDTDFEKKDFMEQILENNIVAFFSGLDLDPQKRIRARISTIKREKVLRFKGVKMHTVNLNFTSNVEIPDFVGLGKGTAFGYGTIMQFNTGKN